MDHKKPSVSSQSAQKQLDEAEKQFETFNEQVKDLTLDRMNAAPKEDVAPQTQMSQKEMSKAKEIYLKPKRTVSSKEKFNEANREDYNFAKEYVYFIAENNEVIGESLELWTKKFPGQPAEFWEVPTNTPVWGPRYLAEQIKNCTYHRLTMEESYRANNIIGNDHVGSYTGNIVIDSIKQRLNAYPASQRKSVFMGASGF
jgi:hypothetical protein